MGMKFYGMINVLISLSLAFIIMEYQSRSLLFDSLFMLLPFMLVMLSIVMNSAKETREANVLFGAVFVLVSLFFLVYAYNQNLLTPRAGVSVYIALGVLDISGILLILGAGKQKGRD